jgi:hypothetical protein
MQALMEDQRSFILSLDPKVSGFNIGITASADTG